MFVFFLCKHLIDPTKAASIGPIKLADKDDTREHMHIARNLVIILNRFKLFLFSFLQQIRKTMNHVP